MAYKMYLRHPHEQAECLLGSRPLWLIFRYLPPLLLGGVVLLLLSIAPARATAPEVFEEPGPSGVGSGHLLMHDEISGRYLPALVQASKVHFAISGMIATVQVEQTFRHPHVSERKAKDDFLAPGPHAIVRRPAGKTTGFAVDVYVFDLSVHDARIPVSLSSRTNPS